MKSYGAMLLLGEVSNHLVTVKYKECPVELYNIVYEFFRYTWTTATDFTKPSRYGLISISSSNWQVSPDLISY